MKSATALFLGGALIRTEDLSDEKILNTGFKQETLGSAAANFKRSILTKSALCAGLVFTILNCVLQQSPFFFVLQKLHVLSEFAPDIEIFTKHSCSL